MIYADDKKTSEIDGSMGLATRTRNGQWWRDPFIGNMRRGTAYQHTVSRVSGVHTSTSTELYIYHTCSNLLSCCTINFSSVWYCSIWEDDATLVLGFFAKLLYVNCVIPGAGQTLVGSGLSRYYYKLILDKIIRTHISCMRNTNLILCKKKNLKQGCQKM